MDNIDFIDLSGTFGLIATFLLTTNLLLGVLLTTKYRRTLAWYRLPERLRSIDLFVIHNYNAYLGLAIAFAHPLLTLFDHEGRFRVSDLLFPPLAQRQNVLYTLGALGFYGMLLLVVTSLGPVRKHLKNRTWKWLHFVSYVAAPLFLVHGLLVDQHLTNQRPDLLDPEKVLSEAGLILVIAAFIFRLRYAKQKRESEKFYSLKVVRVTDEAANVKSFTLEIPAELQSLFRYEPGQFITFRLQSGSSYIKRSYSMSSSPDTDPDLTVTIKRTPGGLVSGRLLDTVKAGDYVEALPPSGLFFRKPVEQPRDYVLFAAGIGITPIFSIVKSLLNGRQQSKVTLVYANRNEASILFRDALEALAHQHSQRLRLIHVLSAPEGGVPCLQGRLTAPLVSKILNEVLTELAKEAVEYYVCGPVSFINLVERSLLERGITAGQIHAEKFTFSPETPIDPAEEKSLTIVEVGEGRNLPAQVAYPGPDRLKVEFQGTIREIERRHDETILDAALRAGLMPPFSCQEGLCASCKATLKSGRVRMRRHEGITRLELDQRNFLSCTAMPISEGVFVSFD